jgi:high-affinity K+ transport system ATPase subunit B
MLRTWRKLLKLSSYADRTPEGRSILEFIQKNYGNFINEKDVDKR